MFYAKIKLIACMKLSLFLLALVILAPGYSYAQLINKDLPGRKGFKINNNLTLHLAGKTNLIYEDNIYLSKTEENSDFITNLSPSAGFEYRVGKNMLSGDYQMNAYFYSDHDSEDHLDHRARGLMEIKLTDYKITLDELYQRFTNRAANEDSSRIRQQNNDFRTGISTERDQLGFDIGYTNKIENYLSDAIVTGAMTYKDKDRMSHIGDFQILYKFMPKTSVILETDLGWIEYDNNLSPDSFYVEPLIGLKGELTNKIRANIKVGFRYQDYKSSELIASEDFNSIVARGGLNFNATKDDLINISVERSCYESTYKDINYYEGSFGKLAYTHKFANKVSLGPYGTYQLNDYPKDSTEDAETKKRQDKLFGGGVSLKYDMQEWISFEAKYEYRQKDSNFSKFNYKDNMVTVSATIGF